ncbi:MAG: polyphosphate kinase 2 family protein [Pyrinomonadaceae bacterium]|nr:polyphosphate kinase 2 family protein [Pyrinomonadaceae bacterium]
MSYVYRVVGNDKISLDDFDASADAELEREEAEAKTIKLIEELIELQSLLYAARRHSVLVVLQGRDTSGKDGVLRKVIGPLDSRGCDVSSFKVPSEEALAHDFLWRIHQQTPALGHIKIFNRSHYEDVLVVRVHNLVPEEVWRRRYDHINNFERLLADSGTVILKFYLHISKDEQEERLLEREKDSTKYWKLSVGDWKEREHWDYYTKAYEDAISHCSSEHAPWLIVPANKKWFRNLAIAHALRDALLPHKDHWLQTLEETGRRELQAIEEYRQKSKR